MNEYLLGMILESVKMSDRLKFDLFYIFKTCLTVCKQMKIFQLSKNVETVQISFCEESVCLCDTLQSNERSTFIVLIQEKEVTPNIWELAENWQFSGSNNFSCACK